MGRWKAILFDLDGTLLDNNMDVFARRFFERLASKLGHLLPPSELVARVMNITREMASHDGARTNEEIFNASFYPLGSCPRGEAESLLRDFYERDFKDLKQHTQRKAEARQVVLQALEAGCDVVLATNPVFPKSAIEQRMAWAGIEDLPFRLVTTSENSRSAKPNPRYFQEVLSQIGRSPSECLMIGDEAGDMVAGQLGCATFLVPSATTKLAENVPTYRGALSEVLGLLEPTSKVSNEGARG